MLIAGPKDLVYDIAVVGKEDQALTVFIEPADGKDALGIIDVVNDVVLLSLGVSSTNDASGFVKSQINRLHLLWLGE